MPQDHGLGLVMRNIDHRGVDLPVQLLQLDAHLGPELGIQVAQRLIEKKDFWPADDGPPDGHPLPLPPRQGLGLAIQLSFDLQQGSGLHDPRPDLAPGIMPQLQPESHILEYRHMRVQGIVLKDHGDIPVAGPEIIDGLAVDTDGSLPDLFQPRDHPEQGRFAATRRAHHDHEFLCHGRQRKYRR